MEESGPHKQSILRNKEVSLKNAPRKPRDVTRPTVMVKRLGFRGTPPVKYKIDFWNNPITASILVWNQVVLNQSQQLGYLNSKLMLSWDCPFNRAWPGGGRLTPPPPSRIFATAQKRTALSTWNLAGLLIQQFDIVREFFFLKSVLNFWDMVDFVMSLHATFGRKLAKFRGSV